MTTAKCLKYKLNNGEIQIDLASVVLMLRAHGYEIDPRMSCTSKAIYQTGEMAGLSYRCKTEGIRQVNDKKSAFHFESRRDYNFKWLQEFRQTYFCLTNNTFVEF